MAASHATAEGSGALSGNTTGGIAVPTALDSSAQAKHLAHADLPGTPSLCRRVREVVHRDCVLPRQDGNGHPEGEQDAGDWLHLKGQTTY